MVEHGGTSPRAAKSTVRLPILIACAGVVVFAVLSVVSGVLYDETEDRLLSQRTAEAAAVLDVAVAQLRSPLDGVARLAAATDGDPTTFVKSANSMVGGDNMMSSVVLYRVGSTTPVAQVGEPPALATQPAERTSALFAADAPFKVVDLLQNGRRLGYAVTDAAESPQFVVYAERVLSADPSVRRRNDEPFAQLDYAIYLGSEARPAAVLGASTRDLPMDGRVSERTFAFGDHQLLLTMRPIGHLSSNLFASLWWSVLILGAVVTVVATWLTRRLLVGRDTALALLGENQRLYQEQRQIAETLQLSLLPQRLAPPPGAEVTAKYWPAGTAALIGGDFYDAFDLGDGRWAMAIGDVCGKGIGSAALIGLARHTLRSAARHTSSPAEVLRAVHQAMADHEPSTFCTACVVFLVPRGEGGTFDATLALGGHPRPILRRADGSVALVGETGSLLGMFEPTLMDQAFVLESGDLLMLYTDGLTDAPADEAVPIEELVETLERDGAQPLELLAQHIRSLKRRRRPRGSADDTAVMFVRAFPADAGNRVRVAAVTATDPTS